MGLFQKKYTLQEFRDLKKKADSLLEEGNPQKAVELYQKIINYRLKDELFTKVRAEASFRMYDLYKKSSEEYAIYALENMLNFYPSKKAYKTIISYYSKKDAKKQLSYAKSFRKIHQNDMEAYKSEISALVKNKKEKEAKSLTNLLEKRIVKKKYVEYLDTLTEIYLDIFLDFDNALRVSDSASVLKQPKTREFWYNRARILKKSSRSIESRRCIENALKKDATYFEALVFKGDIFYESGRLIGAREAYSYAMEVNPDSIEVQNYIRTLNKQIEDKLNFETEIYDGVDFERLEKEGHKIPENIHVLRKEKVLDAIIDEDQTPFPDRDAYGISELFDTVSKIKPQKQNIDELKSLLIASEVETAVKIIDSELRNRASDVKLLYIKGVACLMKGELKKAQSIDDLFWQSSPKTISEELLQRDFNGVFVNIDDEMDYYNQKINEISEGIIEKRFSFDDFEPVSLESDFIDRMFDFLNSPTEDPLLSSVKPVIRKQEIDKILGQ